MYKNELTNKSTQASTGDSQNGYVDDVATTYGDDDIFMLMSMALDGMLDDDENARLKERIAADAAVADCWQQWCKVDVAFHEAPRQLPERGFTNRFEAKLALQQTRALKRQKIAMGAVAAVVWLVVLVIAGAALWFIAANQGQVMGSFARESAYYGRAVSVGVGALRSTVGATFSDPQSLAIFGGYALATGLLLYLWVRVLRRTMNGVENESGSKEIVS